MGSLVYGITNKVERVVFFLNIGHPRPTQSLVNEDVAKAYREETYVAYHERICKIDNG